MTFLVWQIRTLEQRALLRRASASKSHGQTLAYQSIRDRDLFGDIQWVMQVQADHGAADADALRL